MPTMCVQCALEAFVQHDGEPPAGAGWFEDEEPLAHYQRMHPHNGRSLTYRAELERKAEEIIQRKGLDRKV